jgi:CelD/BcsL family acetyltransferase involved in cellulose biosynthesis
VLANSDLFTGGRVTAPAPTLLVLPQLDGWASQWDQLVDQSPLPSPFLRSWWLTGAGGPRGRFLLVVEGDLLLGGLALEERRRFGLQTFQMMGSGPLCPDHLDLLAAPSHEDTAVRLLKDWLCRPGGRILDLKGVRAGSRLIEVLPDPVRCEWLATAPWTPLPDKSESYLAALPSQFRRQVRRASARLAAEGVTHRINRGPSAVRSLETLRELHQAQWGERSRFLPDFDRFAAGCRLGAEVDEVVVHELAIDATVLAIVVSFEVTGRVSLYQSARVTDSRWREATSVLLTTIVADACDRGFTEVDFLRGDEPYKARFVPNRRDLLRLLAGAGGLGRLARLSKTTRSRAMLVAVGSVRAGRRLVGRARLAAQRLRWRQLSPAGGRPDPSPPAPSSSRGAGRAPRPP